MGLFAKRDIPRGTVWWKAKQTNVLLLSRSQYTTLRDIPAGEEITEDYTLYDTCSWCAMTCSDTFVPRREVAFSVVP